MIGLWFVYFMQWSSDFPFTAAASVDLGVTLLFGSFDGHSWIHEAVLLLQGFFEHLARKALKNHIQGKDSLG